MPPWRLTSLAWPLARAFPENENWSAVRKYGPKGIYYVIVGLYWLQQSAGDQSQQNEYLSILEDVSWVLHILATGLVPLDARPHRQAPVPVRAPADPIVPTRIRVPTKRSLGKTGMSPTAPPPKRAKTVLASREVSPSPQAKQRTRKNK